MYIYVRIFTVNNKKHFCFNNNKPFNKIQIVDSKLNLI